MACDRKLDTIERNPSTYDRRAEDELPLPRKTDDISLLFTKLKIVV